MTDSSAANERPTNMWEELNKPKEREDDASRPTDDEGEQRRGTALAGIVAGVAAIAAVGVAGFIVMGGGNDAPEPATAVVEADDELALVDEDERDTDDDLFSDGEADGSSDESSMDDDATTDDATADDASGDDADGDASDGDADAEEAAPDGAEAPDDVYSPAVPAGAGDEYAVLSRGRLYLRGELPTPLHVAGAVSALEQIMGEGNVISEHEINPDAEFVMGEATDVFIEDTVLFALGSAEIASDFYPLLGLGVTLLDLQDGVTIEVYGHTDSLGSDESNLALSQARVDAAKAFFVAQGADPERVIAVGIGESEPVADNETPEGRQLNRRVEIVVEGFVFAL